MSPRRQLAIAIFAASLVASACGDDAESTTAPDPTDSGSSSTSSTTTSTVTGADDDGDEPPIVLDATDIGVTADTIKLAAVYPDLAVIGEDSGDVEAKFQVAVDRINDTGGVNGRMIELSVDLPVPIGIEYEKACVRHTEDEEVFAVVGLFLGDQVLCYTEFHDTIAVNVMAIDEDQLERSTAPLLSATRLATRSVGPNIEALLDAGHLVSGTRVALHGLASDEALHRLYEGELESRGVEVVVSTLRTTENDPMAAEAEVAIYALRWVSEDVDAIIASTGPAAEDLLVQYDRLGLEVPMVLPIGLDRPPSLIARTFGVSPEPFVHAVSILNELPMAQQYDEGVDGVRECVDDFEVVTGEKIELEVSETDLNNLVPVVVSCMAVDLFVAVAEAAGPELTRESFRAAAESFGPIDITGIDEGSLGPDKPDVPDGPPVVGFYDAALDQFAPA